MFGYVSRFTYVGAVKQITKVLVHISTKIAIKSDNITPLGSMFYAMDKFPRFGMNALIDIFLGLCSCWGDYILQFSL